MFYYNDGPDYYFSACATRKFRVPSVPRMNAVGGTGKTRREQKEETMDGDGGRQRPASRFGVLGIVGGFWREVGEYVV